MNIFTFIGHYTRYTCTETSQYLTMCIILMYVFKLKCFSVWNKRNCQSSISYPTTTTKIFPLSPHILTLLACRVSAEKSSVNWIHFMYQQPFVLQLWESFLLLDLGELAYTLTLGRRLVRVWIALVTFGFSMLGCDSCVFLWIWEVITLNTAF